MRKTNILLSLLIFVAMALAACAPEETGVPRADVPPMTAEATETTEATEMPTQEGTATEPGVPVTGEDNPARLSYQLDLNVWDQNGEQVGEVNDMVVDLDNARISYVIVGVGGFLEIGEKDVLVPWESLQLETGTGDMTGGEQNAFVYQGDQELFNNAPDVDISAILPDRNTVVDDWDSDIRSYWESGVVPATEAPEGTAAPEATATLSPEATEAPEEDMAPLGEDLQGVLLASDLLGTGITVNVQTDGEVMPEATALPATEAAEATTTPAAEPVPADMNAFIDDVIVDVDTGEVQYVVLNTSSADGEHWVPVPLNFFQWDAENQVLLLNTDPNTLQEAPSFENGQYPDTTADGWNNDFDAFWQNINPGTGTN